MRPQDHARLFVHIVLHFIALFRGFFRVGDLRAIEMIGHGRPFLPFILQNPTVCCQQLCPRPVISAFSATAR